MGGRRLPALELGEAERAALKALASRRKTAQALAMRARIVLACAKAGKPRGRRPARDRQSYGRQVAPRFTGWMGCATSRALARRARSGTRGSRR